MSFAGRAELGPEGRRIPALYCNVHCRRLLFSVILIFFSPSMFRLPSHCSFRFCAFVRSSRCFFSHSFPPSSPDCRFLFAVCLLSIARPDFRARWPAKKIIPSSLVTSTRPLVITVQEKSQSAHNFSFTFVFPFLSFPAPVAWRWFADLPSHRVAAGARPQTPFCS
ncbi:hypothetical protein DFJ73DRAFT_320566 [Zopfochytrium polystomum]|nr:hypothetical protein DFJ73DRAFT_320566 [Zopfochytrium polystomum]